MLICFIVFTEFLLEFFAFWGQNWMPYWKTSTRSVFLRWYIVQYMSCAICDDEVKCKVKYNFNIVMDINSLQVSCLIRTFACDSLLLEQKSPLISFFEINLLTFFYFAILSVNVENHCSISFYYIQSHRIRFGTRNRSNLLLH